MNHLVVTIIVILLPGIIATVICDKIIVHSKWDAFKFSLYSFVLGVFSYASLQLVYFGKNLCGSSEEWEYLKVWNITISTTPVILWSEIFFAVILSIPVALVVAYIINHKVINKLAQKLNISAKYGDENLYSYYLNTEEIDWVYVRDMEQDITYQGRVVTYSENTHIQELVLSEVTLYRHTDSTYLYEVPTIYLCKKMGGFVIEAIPPELFGESNV